MQGEAVQAVAEEGYIYGYPLVLADIRRRIHTAVASPTETGAPLNLFAHRRFVPGPHTKDALRPYADSLRSTAWLDLSREPVILNIPPTDRYYLVSMLSAWGDLFESVSPRTNGQNGGHFGLVGPRWHGKLPSGIKRIPAPTDVMWINGLIQAAGVEDIQIVHALQDQFRLARLSEWGQPPVQHPGPFRSSIDRHSTPQEQVAKLNAPDFYTRLARLMAKIHPQPADAAIIGRLARIGFIPDHDFVFETLPPHTTVAMHAAVPAAQRSIAEAASVAARHVNNWFLRAHPGRFETNYLARAVEARDGLGDTLAEDVASFQTRLDSSGEALRGTHQYEIQFEQGHVPPVHAFWSITVYDSKRCLSDNVIHRHVIGDRDKLRLNSDNSLSICLQHEWPGSARDSNWLPVPRDAFDLILQLHWPKPEVLNGIWRPPAVMRVH